jgi:DNA-binding PucR family transcriptional regulator
MEQLGFVGLLLGEADGVAAFVRRTLGPVLDYDGKRGTDLIGTLETYFACGRNLAKTKTALRVHVNTVSQRLERIAAVLGDDWAGPERSLEIQLALRLHRLAAR